MTCGCPTRFASRPTARQTSRMKATCAKKAATSCGSVIGGASASVYWTAVMNLLDLLPHRPPMRLARRDRRADRRRARPGPAAACARTTSSSTVTSRVKPIVPAIILVEMLAQVGGLAAAAPPPEPSPPASLCGCGSRPSGPFKFPAAAKPGDELDIVARVAGRLGGLYKIEGDVTANGLIVATGSVTLGRRVTARCWSSVRRVRRVRLVRRVLVLRVQGFCGSGRCTHQRTTERRRTGRTGPSNPRPNRPPSTVDPVEPVEPTRRTGANRHRRTRRTAPVEPVEPAPAPSNQHPSNRSNPSNP